MLIVFTDSSKQLQTVQSDKQFVDAKIRFSSYQSHDNSERGKTKTEKCLCLFFPKIRPQLSSSSSSAHPSFFFFFFSPFSGLQPFFSN